MYSFKRVTATFSSWTCVGCCVVQGICSEYKHEFFYKQMINLTYCSTVTEIFVRVFTYCTTEIDELLAYYNVC